ncbi:molecular chaperone [Clostridium sp. Bc-iso-3]|nr:molecular chaperone [Clostridium sp. Bc-iso-3]
MKKLKFRHEIKHYINAGDYLLLQKKLRYVMKPDSHAGPDGTYLVRSLYFDTPADKALMEKIDGVDNREKFRIRLYDHDDSFIKFEKKMKVNSLTAKFSVNITKDQCKDILNGNIEWMKATDNPILLEIYHKMMHQQLKPRTIVDYTREAYIFNPGNVRVTIDKSIRTGLQSSDLFNKELPTVETLPGQLAVLEVKYDEFLPEVISDIIQIGNRQKLSVSKYALCRMYY